MAEPKNDAPVDRYAAFDLASFEPSRALVTGALVLLILVLQLPFLTEAYRITVDEPWYAATAHAFASGHGLKNELVGSGGGDVFFLYPMMMSSLFLIDGTTFYAGRLFSVAMGVLAVVGLIGVMYRLGLRWMEVTLCGSAFIVSNLSYLTFRAIRPECAGTAFAIWGVYFLLEALRTRSPRDGALCGVAVGAAFLSHPALALFVLLVGIALLVDGFRERAFSAVIAYSVVGLGVLALLLAFMQVSMEEGVVGTLEIMAGRAADVGSERLGMLASTWENATSFFHRLHAEGRRAPIVLLEIIVLGWGLANLRKLGPASVMPLIPIGFLVVGFLTLRPMLLRSFTVVEWMILATFGLMIADLARSSAAWKVHAARAALALLALNNLAGDLYVIKRDWNAISYAELGKAIAAQVPPGSTVMSHMLFWFPLQESKVYTSYSRWRHEAHDDLESLLDSGEVEYVVLLDYDGLSLITAGATGSNPLLSPVLSYRKRVGEWADESGNLVAEIPARGYGKVAVWRVDRS